MRSEKLPERLLEGYDLLREAKLWDGGGFGAVVVVRGQGTSVSNSSGGICLNEKRGEEVCVAAQSAGRGCRCFEE